MFCLWVPQTDHQRVSLGALVCFRLLVTPLAEPTQCSVWVQAPLFVPDMVWTEFRSRPVNRLCFLTWFRLDGHATLTLSNHFCLRPTWVCQRLVFHLGSVTCCNQTAAGGFFGLGLNMVWTEPVQTCSKVAWAPSGLDHCRSRPGASLGCTRVGCSPISWFRLGCRPAAAAFVWCRPPCWAGPALQQT